MEQKGRRLDLQVSVGDSSHAPQEIESGQWLTVSEWKTLGIDSTPPFSQKSNSHDNSRPIDSDALPMLFARDSWKIVGQLLQQIVDKLFSDDSDPKVLT